MQHFFCPATHSTHFNVKLTELGDTTVLVNSSVLDRWSECTLLKGTVLLGATSPTVARYLIQPYLKNTEISL